MKKITAFLLFAAMFFTLASPFSAYALTQQELEKKISSLDSEIKKNKEYLSSVENKKQSQKKYLATLEAQISAVEKKVDALETQIASIDREIEDCNKRMVQLANEIAVIKVEIDEADKEIKKTNKKVNESKDLLSQKLRAAYINGHESTLKILMGADSLAGFLTSLELMKRTSEEDKRVIGEFKSTIKKLSDTKKTFEKKQTELSQKNEEIQQQKNESVEKKKELVAKQLEHSSSVKELENSYAEVESYISDLDKNSATYQSYIKKLQKEKDDADAEIDRIIREYQAQQAAQKNNQGTTLPSSNSNSPTPNSAGGSYPTTDKWAWPLGGASCYISSPFGNRSASISGWSFHGGLDIAGGGILDKPIYATRAGTVIKAVKVTDNPYGAKGQGYANYVLIDHGDGFISLYGHCYRINVSSGQTVAKGQQIATVGSTGNSTGPHLHFEIRYLGTKLNPSKYVGKP